MTITATRAVALEADCSELMTEGGAPVWLTLIDEAGEPVTPDPLDTMSIPLDIWNSLTSDEALRDYLNGLLYSAGYRLTDADPTPTGFGAEQFVVIPL